MPRSSREKSQTGIYHVMLRGIDKRDIFLTQNDNKKFLHYIELAKEKSEIFLLAYCLMSNHVHMLLKEGKEEIGNFIRRVAVGYAQYYNRNHGRTGHLFQNRYQSEPVNDDKYLLVVFRYIHQNPLKAGIVKNIGDYKWSSYNDYLNNKKGITDKGLLKGYFSNIENFIVFNNQKNKDKCLEYEGKKIYSDTNLRQIVSEIIEIEKLPMMEIKTRNMVLRRIKNETGASIRQLERVLGIGRNII
ncbi:MAG: transposase, partial [Candidatus Syntrophonatronum acetioxidans]